jgi:hypothetical protein
VRLEECPGLFHRPRCHQHLGDKRLIALESLADHRHPAHQAVVNNRSRCDAFVQQFLRDALALCAISVDNRIS